MGKGRNKLGGALGKDYRFTNSALDSIFSNLSTQGARLSAKLTKQQAGTLGKMHALGERFVGQAQDKVHGSYANQVNSYGSAMGQVIKTQMKPARAAAHATTIEARGLLRGAAITKKGGKIGLAIQQSATAEAQAGAKYAMATALANRIVDRQNAAAAGGSPKQQLLQGGEDLALQLAQDPATTMAVASANVDAYIRSHNLSPSAAAELRSYAASLYTDGTSNVATPPTDNLGNPILTEPSDADYATYRSQAVQAVNAGKELQAVIDAAVVPLKDDKGNWIVSDAYAQKVVDYITETYNQAKATYDEVTAAMGDTPDVQPGAANQASAAATSAPGDIKLLAKAFIAGGALTKDQYRQIAAYTGTDAGQLIFGDATERARAINMLQSVVS